MSTRAQVAVIGSGNIGTDLMIKIIRLSETLEMAAMVGIDPDSDGLARARRFGAPTTSDGVEGLLAMDSCRYRRCLRRHLCRRAQGQRRSAPGHRRTTGRPHPRGHRAVLRAGGEPCRALRRPQCEHGDLRWAGHHSDRRRDLPGDARALRGDRGSIASRSAGPGTRANIDEFTETTAHAVAQVGGAERGKAVIILNPAEPPMIMRDTVTLLADAADRDAIQDSVAQMVADVAAYVPGYRLKQAVQVQEVPAGDRRRRLVEGAAADGDLWHVSVFLEVEGAAHYLPAYAGNLDIMTSAALRVGETLADRTAPVGPLR